MKNTTMELVYVPLSSVTTEQIASVLKQNCESLKRRGVDTTIEVDRIVGRFWEEKCEGSAPKFIGCSFNSYVDSRLLDQMRVQQVMVTYNDATIPFQDSGGEMETERKERYSYEIGNRSTFIHPIIARFPSQQAIIISLEFPEGDHSIEDLHRRAVLNAMFLVEKKIRAVKSVEQLIQAMRTSPRNQGFINRSIKELYGTIGRFS